ncbi:hypothetical protein PC129_g117 [Phytophthora cactorum]|uniref:Uncharacterized protein n=1 Tax=Phytophthora cactorum TaxID=29920 RepID=A0A8T1IY24_9STRA|nr:hypothetical protein Pcac1_g207 [Phytophthora cactorum]KAG2934396.1 hypothetical protein PC114_g960 [Phytophthora cactorum]KAG2955386.1 hypothetical protein PC117_g420 [Phytophthora cactorum]KAG3000061.1 hypothetical protein PC118_g517 [Phytophthora cactorum]KAG3017137.1 hypothetical protein PC120_g11184 [Phytophthora cactorum]
MTPGKTPEADLLPVGGRALRVPSPPFAIVDLHPQLLLDETQPDPSRLGIGVRLPVTETDPHRHHQEEKCHHVDRDLDHPHPTTQSKSQRIVVVDC